MIPTLVLAVCFCLLFYSQASADSGDLDEMTSVESVLVKRGDTVTSIARRYVSSYSYGSEEEYIRHILELNNMDSGYIRSGTYILLPNYRN